MQAYKIETRKITYYSAKGTYQYCCTRGQKKNTFSSFFFRPFQFRKEKNTKRGDKQVLRMVWISTWRNTSSKCKCEGTLSPVSKRTVSS